MIGTIIVVAAALALFCAVIREKRALAADRRVGDRAFRLNEAALLQQQIRRHR